MRNDVSLVQLADDELVETSSLFREIWWDRLPSLRHWHAPYIAAFQAGEEIGRIHLNLAPPSLREFGVPYFAESFVQIVHIEIREDLQRRGLGFGPAVVDALLRSWPAKPFSAFSADADEFWGELGWQRFENVFDSERGMPLFVHRNGAES